MCFKGRRTSIQSERMPSLIAACSTASTASAAQSSGESSATTKNPAMTHRTSKMRIIDASSKSDRPSNSRQNLDSLVLRPLSTAHTEDTLPNKRRKVSSASSNKKDSFPFVLAPPNLASPPIMRTIPPRKTISLTMRPSMAFPTNHDSIKSSLYNIEMKVAPSA